MKPTWTAPDAIDRSIARDFLATTPGVTAKTVAVLVAGVRRNPFDPLRKPARWSEADDTGCQRCRVCKGNGFRFGKLRPAETCGNCASKGCRFVKGGL